ncbi:MAG: hypothetical protein U0228_08680 [Myxococcaceae bacterium]
MVAAERRRTGPLAAQPELWAALGQGVRLRAILTRFYARAFGDARLLPFFKGQSPERLVDKQYAFLAEIFTGERTYFGDRPRNAHHWMVIDDALFDYREMVFFEEVARELTLDEALLAKWRAAHEAFRKQIVKSKPFPRRMAGVDMPLGGWERDTLAAGTLCDKCQRELGVGVQVVFHKRLGTTHCLECGPEDDPVLAAAEGAA